MNLRSLGNRMRQRGTSLVEVTVSTGLLLVILALGVPVYKSIGDAGDEGSARLTVQVNNQQTLLRIVGELQNTSTTQVDALGNPRLSIADGAAPQPLVDRRTNGLGGYKGTLGTVAGDGSFGDASATGSGGIGPDTAGHGTAAAGDGQGSGHRGGTYWGRARDPSMTGASKLSSAAVRPRFRNIPLNSELTFQKVEDYTVDGTGAPVINWGDAITYRIRNRKLERVQGGRARVVCPHAVAFRAEVTDVGTVLVTLVTQKRSNSSGKVTYQANQVEVGPKN